LHPVGRGFDPLSLHHVRGLSEWSKEAVLKTVRPRGLGGSNPSSSAKNYSAIAQQVEQVTVNHWVPGSNPGRGAIFVGRLELICERIVERFL
jgi:hypothetical protein